MMKKRVLKYRKGTEENYLGKLGIFSSVVRVLILGKCLSANVGRFRGRKWLVARFKLSDLRLLSVFIRRWILNGIGIRLEGEQRI